MSEVKTPNCIVLNKNTGVTHYSTCDCESKITESHTFCGKTIHDRYEVTTTDLWHNKAKCEVCDLKERGMRGSKEHWLYVPMG